MKVLSGLFPAKVVSYDGPSRLCLVEIDGISTGADQHLEAEIMYSLGDKSHNTEIEILAGDLLWVQFHGGDPRYPIIVGYRTLNEDASVGKRRWHHLNIEIEADDKAEVIVGDTKITSVPDSITMTIGNAMIKAEDGKITLKVGSNEVFVNDVKMETTGIIEADGDVIGGKSGVPISLTTHSHIGNLGANVSPPLP